MGKKQDLIESAARILKIPTQWLDNLLWAESGQNPKAKNPKSTARGIMQWVDIRARDLGYKNSRDLIAKNPTFEQQLQVTTKDLKRFAPFESEHEFYMAVFLPAKRKTPANELLDKKYRSVNQGINTPADYTEFVRRMAKKKKTIATGKKTSTVVIPLIVAILLYRAIKNQK